MHAKNTSKKVRAVFQNKGMSGKPLTTVIPTPTEYWQSQGRKNSALSAVPHKWGTRTVADILERQEYIGDTVNFRCNE